MLKRQLVRNSVVSAVQVVVSSGVLFLLYLYLVQSIGIADVGIWAIVLATASAGSVANLGIATSTVKFVAQYQARKDGDAAVSVVATSVISVAVIVGLFVLLAFPIFEILVAYFVPEARTSDALTILPFALGSFWINSISTTFQSALDGIQRIDLRGYILMGASIIFLAAVYVLVPVNGLLGLAQAQLVQAVVSLIFSSIILLRFMPSLHISSFKWSRQTFTTIIGYSVRFQAISISRMLVEPVTKVILAKFGGLSATGYFEMASKLIMQARAVVITAYQSFVPAVAELVETDAKQISKIYQRSFDFIFLLGIVGLTLLVASSQSIATLWLGGLENFFVMTLIIVASAWFVNLLSAPAYFINLGTGELKDNIIGHVLTAAINICIGILLGIEFAETGVVVGYALAIAGGSFATTWLFQSRQEVPVSNLVSRDSLRVLLVSMLGMATCLVGFEFINGTIHPLLIFTVVLLMFILIVSIPVYRHYLWEMSTTMLRDSLSFRGSTDEGSVDG